jgi:hypothetical protein
MSDPLRRGLPVVVALVFALVTLGIGFFHTEDSVSGQRDCPACQFQSSSLSTSPTALVSLPPLVCRGLIVPVEPLQAGETLTLSRSCRAPPQA